MAKYYDWKVFNEDVSGVIVTIACEGQVHEWLEVQLLGQQDNFAVAATAWRDTPPTLWETGDRVCVYEVEFTSVADAVLALQQLDSDELRAELELEEKLKIV